MIKDKLINSETYSGLSKNFEQGFEWLKNNDLLKLADGKYVISDDLYANVQTYETKESALYEAHREYADIQYMIKGVEKVGVCDYKDCAVNINYDSEKDIEFLDCLTSPFQEILREGEFLVLFPQDAHQPSMNYDTKSTVKKVVVKVKL